MRLIRSLSRWLTRGYARTLDFEGVTEEATYRVGSIERKVYWVNAEDWKLAGQYTPFGTILLNKTKLEGVSQEVKDYVFLHEVGHASLPRPLSLLSLSVRLPVTALAVLGIPFLMFRWLASVVLNPTPRYAILSFVGYLILCLLILVLFTGPSWLEEGHAELYAVDRVGKETYRRCHKEVRQRSERGLFRRVLHRLVYPPPRLVLWAHERLTT